MNDLRNEKNEQKNIITVFIGSNPLSPNKEMRSYAMGAAIVLSWNKINDLILLNEKQCVRAPGPFNFLFFLSIFGNWKENERKIEIF